MTPLAIRTRVGRLFGVHEWLLMALLALWTFAPVVWLLTRTHSGDLYTGADGPFAGDALQYLSWIRESGNHVLVANRFDTAPAGHVFLHPMFLLSGLLWKAGLPLQVAYLLWKPVAIVGVVAASAAYARRLLPERTRDVPLALVLALFFAPPTVAIADWLFSHPPRTLLAVGGEISVAGLSWGGTPVVIAIALMPVFLLGVEKLVDRARRRPGRGALWYAAWSVAAGLVLSWLHPWQGETLLVALICVAPWVPRGRRLLMAPPALALLAPIAYYFLLSRFAAAWEVAERQNHASPQSVLGVALALAPIGALAIVGARGRRRDFQERALIAWPLAALVVHYFLSPSVPSHAFEGMSIPLAVLAVRGIRRLDLHSAAAVVVIVLLVVPGLEQGASFMHTEATSGREPHVVARPEADALRYLEHSDRPGGVLTTPLLGGVVPPYTGRSTWVGHRSWTPDFSARGRQADALFAGRMPPSAARALVRGTHASFVLSPCGARFDAAAVLGPSIASARRFGCAAVYALGR